VKIEALISIPTTSELRKPQFRHGAKRVERASPNVRLAENETGPEGRSRPSRTAKGIAFMEQVH